VLIKDERPWEEFELARVLVPSRETQLEEVIRTLRAFAQHDKSCPWHDHPFGERRRYSECSLDLRYLGIPRSGTPEPCEPCRCGLGRLDAKIDSLLPN